VSVQRRLPDGVVLAVTERVAAASLAGGDSRWLISTQGKLLEESAGTGVVEITGLTAVSPYVGSAVQVAEEDENTLTYVLALLTALDSRGMLEDCTALDCTAAASFTLTYQIYQVKLPRTTEYGSYLSLLQGALDNEKLPQDEPGVCDLTVEDGKLYFRRIHEDGDG
jgi:hypothetical protein